MQLKLILFSAAFLFCIFGYSQPKIIDISKRTKLPSKVFSLLSSYDIILCGEFHGTNESPQFIEGLVNLLIDSGQNVLLALEIEESNQGAVDSFLVSGDFTLIKKMDHFNYKPKDGRSSVAMAALIKKMYKKNNIKIICFDPAQKVNSGQERDSLMALNVIKAVEKNKNYKLVLLAGGLHCMLKQGYYNNPQYKSMGYFIKSSSIKNNKIISLDIIYGSGTAWYCQEDTCGKKPLVPDNIKKYNEFSRAKNFICLEDTSGKFPIYLSGYMGFFGVKHMTASRPLND